MSDEIGKWYENQRKKADNVRERIIQTEARMKANCKCTTFTPVCFVCKEDKLELKQLNKELDLALYVGD